MKAMHQESKKIYSVKEIGPKVILQEEYQEPITMTPHIFRRDYKLIEDPESYGRQTMVPPKDMEKKLASERADKVIDDIRKGKTNIVNEEEEPEMKKETTKPRTTRTKPEAKPSTKKVEEKKKATTPNKATEAKVTKGTSQSEVSLAELCTQLGIDPSKARAKLRKGNIQKPYSWSGTELTKVKTILSK